MLAPDGFKNIPSYVAFTFDKGTIRFKLYDVPWCSPRLWWELRRFGQFFNVEPNAMPKLITQHWRSYNSWVVEFGETFLQLRGAYDVRGSIEQHYLRALDHPIASTVGLLILLGTRALNARPASTRPVCMNLFSDFVNFYVGADDYEIALTLDAPFPCALSCTPADGQLQLPVDAGVVSCSALLGGGGVFQTKFDTSLSKVGAITEVGRTSTSLGPFWLLSSALAMP